MMVFIKIKYLLNVVKLIDKYIIINLCGRKPGTFQYYLPVEIHKFVNSDQLKGKAQDTDNFFICILKVMQTGSGKFRYPSWFNGYIGNIFDSIETSTFSNAQSLLF